MPRTIESTIAELVPDGECLVWPHGRTEKGYGQVVIGGRNYRVHRLVWEHAHGPIPPGVQIRHSCDNPPCARLDHLRDGTPADNMADKVKHGRQSRGESHGRAVLTDELVRTIRASTGTTTEIAARLGVDRTQCGKIRRGVAWAHVV